MAAVYAAFGLGLARGSAGKVLAGEHRSRRSAAGSIEPGRHLRRDAPARRLVAGPRVLPLPA